MTHLNTILVPATLALACCLPACGQGASVEASSSGADQAMGMEEPDPSLDQALADEPIPSQDVADAAAEAEIDESNADEVLAELKAEIDG